MPVGMYTIY